MILAAYILLLGIGGIQQGLVSGQTLEADLCGKTDSANASLVPFSYSNNAWGNITGQATGYQCLKIYDDGKSWTATYQWSGDPTLVKAYPRMRAWPSNLPLQLSTLSQLLVNANFKTYTTEGGDNDAAYTSAGLVANVALDLFVAPTADGATQVSPPTEIMVWPWWTPTILPLGYTTSTPQKDTIQVNGVTWSLYHGVNEGGQNVFSWLAQSNVTSLNGDYAPLISYLVKNNYMSGDMWASQLQLGQEMKMALKETNFQVDASELRIVRADEGEMSVLSSAPSTSPPPTPTSLPYPTSTETSLVTTTVAAPTSSLTTSSAVPITTTAMSQTSTIQATLSTSGTASPASSTSAEPPESSAPAPTTPTTTVAPVLTTTSIVPLTTTSEAPVPTTEPSTTSRAAPSSSAINTPTTTAAPRTSGITTTTSRAATSTVAATTTTSNAAINVAQPSRYSLFMLIVTYMAGFL